MTTYQEFYASLAKPAFAPPEWIFGLAWGIIYPLIAIAFALVIYGLYTKKVSKSVLWLFIINMIANFAFTPVQLGTQNNILSSIVILIVLGTLLAMMKQLCHQKAYWIFGLLVPYVLWGTFATVLLLTITVMNL